MQKYQERVVAERDELVDKITKLTKFLYSERALRIPLAEEDRMKKQLASMLGYAGALCERIKAFKI